MTRRERMLRTYWRLERAVSPGLRNAQLAYEDVLKLHVRETKSWLDLGCGRRILPAWRGEAEAQLALRGAPEHARVVGVDLDHRALVDNASIACRCRASATRLPFADGTFDLVTANMVVEHLDDPARQFREVARVMKGGGVFLIHTPNSYGYPALFTRLVPYALQTRLARRLDGRATGDVYPTFYRANSRRAIDRLVRDSSLRIRELEFVRSTPLFGIVPPLALVELLWSRALKSERLRTLRSNIIAVLEKLEPPSSAEPRAPASSS